MGISLSMIFRTAEKVSLPSLNFRSLSLDFPPGGGRRVKGLCGSLVLGRGLVTQRRMPPDAVVEHFDVFEDTGLRLPPRGVLLAVDQLLLQAGEEGFHRRIVPAVAPPAHAAGDPLAAQQPLVMVASILAPPV